MTLNGLEGGGGRGGGQGLTPLPKKKTFSVPPSPSPLQPIQVSDCVVEQTVVITSPQIQERIVGVVKVRCFIEERHIFEEYTKLQNPKAPEAKRLSALIPA